jgi:glucose/arabinose dehydrogenase
MGRLNGVPRRAAVAALATVAALLLPAAAASAGTVPSGFQESVVLSGFTEPTTFAFSPDGRVFVGEKSGIIKVYDSLSDPTPEVFADLSTEAHDFWDRGLLGMALDPDFPAKPYVYVLYTLDAPPGGTAPKWGGVTLSDGCPTPPGPTTDGCVVSGRLAKLTATGNEATGQTNLITDWCQQFPSHSVGDLAFGPDGSLYVSGGDGASFTTSDWGQFGNPQVNPCGDPPAGVGGAMTPTTSEGGSLRSQDVRTPADPTGLNGSLLRIDPETGLAKAGNPLALSASANAQRIVAYGMRNPFRFTMRPGTNEVWVGDVGQGTWEEIDRVANPTGAAPYNFGWPCYEGNNDSSARMPAWDALNNPLCETLYDQGPGAVTAPYFSYKHTSTVVSGETCPTGSSSVSGLAFYGSGQFPNAYNGALFFADYSRACIWAMMPGAGGLPDPSNIQTFDAGAHGPVNLKVGPDGSLYFADLTGGKIWRISHSNGNQPPIAVATANPENGASPLNVQLSAAGSSDPDPGDTLSYAWDLDGDGQFDDSTLQAPTHVYSSSGTHVATVRVSDPDGASDANSVSIQVDNTPPTATITAPLSTATWAVGDQIPYSATATDAQQGTLPDSAYKWKVILHHCPSNCHEHAVVEASGSSGFFVAPDHDYPSWLEFRLTVTDAGGLTDTETVKVDPKTVSLEVQTLPVPGLEVVIDGTAGESPFTATVIKGSNHTVATQSQTLGGHDYAFGAWSDGGDAAHSLIVNQNISLTAVFGPPAAPTIASTSPASPNNSSSPKVSGSVGTDFPTAVKIYTGGSCTGPAAASGTAAQFTGSGIAVPVPSDATTQLRAVAANAAGDSACSNLVSYTEDSTAPAAPTLASTPLSPANDNKPKVSGSAEAGSAVRVFKSSDCSGPAAATGGSAQFASGLALSVVPDNADTPLSATATDIAGNVSGCSAAIHYVEDSAAPAPPKLSLITRSPGNSNKPKLGGRAEAGATVRVFAVDSCSGQVLATGSAAQLAAGLAVTVPSNSHTTLAARAIDAAGNTSPCSKAVGYVEDSTAPQTKLIGAPKAHIKRGPGGRAKVSISFATNDPSAHFVCGLDRAKPSRCTSPFRAKLKAGRHKLTVTAVDAAGNADPTPATRKLQVR